MKILALDLAKSTGWAAASRGGRISFGTARFPQKDFGDLAIAFRAWLIERIEATKPDLVAYEAPVVKHPHATKILVGLSWIVILTCRERAIACTPVGNTAAKRHFAGTVYGKSITPYPGLVEARRRGLAPKTTDEADAIAILFYARDNDPLQSGGRATADRKPAQRKRGLSRNLGKTAA